MPDEYTLWNIEVQTFTVYPRSWRENSRCMTHQRLRLKRREIVWWDFTKCMRPHRGIRRMEQLRRLQMMTPNWTGLLIRMTISTSLAYMQTNVSWLAIYAGHVEGNRICLLKSTAVKLKFTESNVYRRFSQALNLGIWERCVVSAMDHYSTGRWENPWSVPIETKLLQIQNLRPWKLVTTVYQKFADII